ncbi:unnamed protein product [Macrosiphum euphorbiae]|uniref:Uncharacterized protein n=1 Tax=Macrosiphum euphorbiae TaxID=13131 RepID=A0AAV0WSA2_9HEMI|nr:unnamed protein product [Macrosiphum euphorbiae]
MQKTSTQSSKSSPPKHQNKAITEDNTNYKQTSPTTSEDDDDDINSTHSTSSQPHKINPKNTLQTIGKINLKFWKKPRIYNFFIRGF